MSKKLVVIGNGMAPGRVLDHLFEKAPGEYEVTIFNAEPRVNYDRIMLSPVLSGEKAYEDIIIHDDAWYEKHGVTLLKGKKVVEIDRAARKVVAEDGTEAEYDKLLIATGSSPFVIPVPGKDLDGVVTYRDLDDVDKMLKVAEGGGSAVVIGGGLLGLEAAYGLKQRGMTVTVLHLMPTLMERQLDPSAGYLLEKALADRDIKIITRANTQEIMGADGKVAGVKLDDGSEIPAEIVVMAVGIKPNAQLADDAGLETNRGILVDDHMVTSDPDILSVGECVEHRGQCYGLVAPLYEMAKVIAANLSGDGDPAYTGSVTATKLKVTGIDLYSAGDFAEADDREEIVLRDATGGIYKRLVLKDNKIIGAVLYGDTADGAWFFDLLKKETDISEMRETLIFGQAYAGGSPLDPTAAVAALPDDAEICGCNGVCKGTIVQAITDKGLTGVDDVRAHTKASSSCGTCTGLVEQLLAVTLGDAFQPDAVQPMCGCTDMGHDDVRRMIVAQELKSIPAVLQELNWKTSCGCAKCRPALNYYLLATWPGEYVDDKQSRFINERVHANIQKDGTYSVGAVVDVDNAAEINARGRQAFLEDCLRAAPEVASIVDLDDPRAEARIIREWSYNAERMSMGRAFLAGDSACFTDPLFSQGVHLATQSGVYAGAAIDFLIDHPDRADDVHAWYDAAYRESYSQYHEFLASFYSYASEVMPASSFWSKRRVQGLEDKRFSDKTWFARLTGQAEETDEDELLRYQVKTFTRDSEGILVSRGWREKTKLTCVGRVRGLGVPWAVWKAALTLAPCPKAEL